MCGRHLALPWAGNLIPGIVDALITRDATIKAGRQYILMVENDALAVAPDLPVTPWVNPLTCKIQVIVLLVKFRTLPHCYISLSGRSC
ncbi:MAG: hypothetical protein JWQ02_1639 [Capsulimonas sp.]|jgi:hypothetical protein|nr:hypothetical protein [Capsulimonas sp.]